MKKKFDCVQMKWEIQRKLMREEQGLSTDERNRRCEAKALSDPILGPWFRKVEERRPAVAAVVAESRGEYPLPRGTRKSKGSGLP